MNRADDPVYMLSYLGYAMEAEKYVYLWEQLLEETKKKIQNMRQTRSTAGVEIENSKERIERLPLVTQQQARQENARIKGERRKKALLLTAASVFFGASIFTVGLTLISAGLSNAEKGVEYIGAAIFGCVLILIPFIIPIGYSIWKKKKSRGISAVDLEISERQKEEEYISELSNVIQMCNQQEPTLLYNYKYFTQQLAIARRQRAEIYSKNLVDVAYRGLIPIGTMYGYLKKRRCTCIAGHGGIYDTYDHDLMLGNILNEQKITNMKLDLISRQLDSIESNQELILGEIRDLSRTMDHISSTVDSIKADTTSIRDSASAAACAAQQTAAYSSYVAGVHYMNYMS